MNSPSDLCGTPDTFRQVIAADSISSILGIRGFKTAKLIKTARISAPVSIIPMLTKNRVRNRSPVPPAVPSCRTPLIPHTAGPIYRPGGPHSLDLQRISTFQGNFPL